MQAACHESSGVKILFERGVHFVWRAAVRTSIPTNVERYTNDLALVLSRVAGDEVLVDTSEQ